MTHPIFISHSVSGNVHQAIDFVNQFWWAQYLHQVVGVSGNGSIIILKVTDRQDFRRVWHELDHRPLSVEE